MIGGDNKKPEFFSKKIMCFFISSKSINLIDIEFHPGFTSYSTVMVVDKGGDSAFGSDKLCQTKIWAVYLPADGGSQDSARLRNWFPLSVPAIQDKDSVTPLESSTCTRYVNGCSLC